MTGKQKMADAQGRYAPEQAPDFASLLEQYGGPIRFNGTEDALFARHLVFDNVADPAEAAPRQQYEALARSIAGGTFERVLTTFEIPDALPADWDPWVATID